ncbi:MAG: hypothetical protein DRQ13_04450 [Ignavibacteriae bacterium]|nr:MAG: hypothetical protein DRQ13_04450 [Ignavibacteriota bacterium]
MKIFKIFFILTFMVTSGVIFAQQESAFQYVSPLPDSKLLSRETNIIFSHTDFIEQSSLNAEDLLQVIGSKSGKHLGDLILSDDGKTVVFNPYKPFAAGETVTVTLNQGIKTLYGKSLKPETFSFSITPLQEPIKLDPAIMLESGITTEELNSSKQIINKTRLDTLPSDFPPITVDTSNNPSDGKLFLANLSGAFNSGNYLMILNNDGSVVNYKEVDGLFGISFTVLPNGELSYAQIIAVSPGVPVGRFIVMDTTLAPVDTFQCSNGYITHPSDFILLPNGHAILHATDPQPVDMSQYGGSPNAIVVGNVVQELDESKNVVFQWRSWDYLPISDSYVNLTTPIVDLTHANALALDANGNILYSIRHTSSIISISRQTGNVNWILGGKRDQFTYINEHSSNAPNYFSYQHDIRVLPNGNITLFDNGTQHSPPYSRGVEYNLDEQNKTATLVWEFRHSPDFFAGANGSMQRLANGTTIIGWGSASLSGTPLFTEVHPDNNIALEFSMPPGQRSFRALKFPWASGLPTASVTIQEVLQGNTYIFNNSTDTTGTTIKFNYIEGFYNQIVVKRFEYSPINPSFEDRAPLVYPASITIEAFSTDTLNIDVWFKVDQIPQIIDPANTIVYHRPTIDSGVFKPLSTSYLPGTNELKVSGVGYAGEFIFGYPDVPVVPTIPGLVSPLNNQLVNQNDSLELEWSPTGFADKFYLQVSTDQNFTSPVVDDSNLTSLTYTLITLLQEQDYFWRVKSKNLAGWGGWSDEWTFKATAPYLDLVFPDGGEVWKTDTSMTIQWDHNIVDSVKIELYKNSTFHSIIIDSMFSITGGYKWLALDSLPDGSDYKVKVSTLDGSFVDMSSGNFTIIYVPVGVQEIEEIATDFRLEQNYPNPFNPSTTIRYAVPLQSYVTVKIYNSLGENIAELVNLSQSAGSYQVVWNASYVASGIYFYSMEAVPTDGSNPFKSVRKMILLK